MTFKEKVKRFLNPNNRSPSLHTLFYFFLAWLVISHVVIGLGVFTDIFGDNIANLSEKKTLSQDLVAAYYIAAYDLIIYFLWLNDRRVVYYWILLIVIYHTWYTIANQNIDWLNFVCNLFFGYLLYSNRETFIYKKFFTIKHIEVDN